MHATALIAQPHSAVVTVRGGSDRRARGEGKSRRAGNAVLRFTLTFAEPLWPDTPTGRATYTRLDRRPLTRAYEHGGVRVRTRAALVLARARCRPGCRGARRCITHRGTQRATCPATRKRSHSSRSHSQLHARSRTRVENE